MQRGQIQVGSEYAVSDEALTFRRQMPRKILVTAVPPQGRVVGKEFWDSGASVTGVRVPSDLFRMPWTTWLKVNEGLEQAADAEKAETFRNDLLLERLLVAGLVQREDFTVGLNLAPQLTPAGVEKLLAAAGM